MFKTIVPLKGIGAIGSTGDDTDAGVAEKLPNRLAEYLPNGVAESLTVASGASVGWRGHISRTH